MNRELLTREKIKDALSFYIDSGIIKNFNYKLLKAAEEKAIKSNFIDIDISYLIEEFDNSVFYYRMEEYGIAFMESESIYSYAIEQLVSDIAKFTNYRFNPEPLTIKYDKESDGNLSFVQKGVVYQQALYTERYYMDNLLELLNEAIVHHSGNALLLYVFHLSDAETQVFVLLSEENQQKAFKNELLPF
ncbi:MAG: hypothetical protein EOO61_10105 [Hymenobacter sp.]|nr:MAG: hypothetical protein EOO61_10105 [Hymenobacter sp.]